MHRSHLWEKGTPSAHHRQEPYSAEQAIAGMDAAGVDRALIHPVMWDPDSNELAVEAVRRYPDRFAIMGWFYLVEVEPKAEHARTLFPVFDEGTVLRLVERRRSCRRSRRTTG
jgi:hypothetical protein